MPITKPRRKSPVVQVTTEPQHCSIDLRMRILGRLPFFAGLPVEAIAEINRHFNDTGFAPGERIYTEGDPANKLYVVAEGNVKILQHPVGKRDVLLEILSVGDFFGNLTSLGASSYSDSAEVQSQSCILSINSEDFRQILDQHPELALRALDIMAARLQDANQRVMRLSALPAEERIATTLLKLAQKLGRQKAGLYLIDVPLSRDDLAEMTATTPETASRVMSQLQAQGIIESGRKWVGIRDLAGLEALCPAL